MSSACTTQLSWWIHGLALAFNFLSNCASLFLFVSSISAVASRPLWIRRTSVSVTGFGLTVNDCHGDEMHPKPESKAINYYLLALAIPRPPELPHRDAYHAHS